MFFVNFDQVSISWVMANKQNFLQISRTLKRTKWKKRRLGISFSIFCPSLVFCLFVRFWGFFLETICWCVWRLVLYYWSFNFSTISMFLICNSELLSYPSLLSSLQLPHSRIVYRPSSGPLHVDARENVKKAMEKFFTLILKSSNHWQRKRGY